MPWGKVVKKEDKIKYKFFSRPVDKFPLVIDNDGKIVEGYHKASVDTIALCYIYEKMPQVNAIVHTHQPYATGLGLVFERIDCDLTALANTTKGHLNVAPYSLTASLEIGIAVVDYIGDSLAVVLKNHGVVTVGKNLIEALYAAVYLEESTKTLYVAHSLNRPVAKLTEEQIQVALDVFKTYGQVPDEH